MLQLHLPSQHNDADLALAGALAQMLRSEELYVAWSVEQGPAEPVVAATMSERRPAASERAGVRAWLRQLRRTA